MITREILIDIEAELSKWEKHKREIWKGPIGDEEGSYSNSFNEYSKARAILELLRKEIGIV